MNVRCRATVASGPGAHRKRSFGSLPGFWEEDPVSVQKKKSGPPKRGTAVPSPSHPFDGQRANVAATCAALAAPRDSARYCWVPCHARLSEDPLHLETLGRQDEPHVQSKKADHPTSASSPCVITGKPVQHRLFCHCGQLLEGVWGPKLAVLRGDTDPSIFRRHPGFGLPGTPCPLHDPYCRRGEILAQLGVSGSWNCGPEQTA
mmetsp:Transcript_108577/g.187763  ORF Transcript_108577/g.187763 Transcript_108577/m.187763 type:complete len:204 (+) Transcript_108577:1228-1839(+)